MKITKDVWQSAIDDDNIKLILNCFGIVLPDREITEIEVMYNGIAYRVSFNFWDNLIPEPIMIKFNPITVYIYEITPAYSEKTYNGDLLFIVNNLVNDRIHLEINRLTAMLNDGA